MSSVKNPKLGSRAALWLNENISTPRVVVVAGWVLLAVGVLMLVRAGILGRSTDEQKLEANATAAAAIVAIAALLLTLGQQLFDKSDLISRFYLEEYRKGYDSAYDVLMGAAPGDPILRMKWIAAARILEAARRLSEKITVPSHRDVMNMDIPRQAERFQKFLRFPAAYYYGVDPAGLDWYGRDFLDEAARLSTKTVDGTMNAHTEVEEKVIFTVWKAIQYPSSYADVMGGEFEETNVWILPIGLRTYIEHARRYESAMGKLYERKDRDPPSNAGARQPGDGTDLAEETG